MKTTIYTNTDIEPAERFVSVETTDGLGCDFYENGDELEWQDGNGLLSNADPETVESARLAARRTLAAAALGSVKSKAKAAAARENGKKGGRPTGQWFAVVQSDGPAFGIGTTEHDAMQGAARWCEGGEFKIVRITRASYRAVKAGNPDAWQPLAGHEPSEITVR